MESFQDVWALIYTHTSMWLRLLCGCVPLYSITIRFALFFFVVSLSYANVFACVSAPVARALHVESNIHTRDKSVYFSLTLNSHKDKHQIFKNTMQSRYLTLLLIALLICSHCKGVTLAERKATPHNFAQACRDELTDVCDNRYIDYPDCLGQHFLKVKSLTCKGWLIARSLCIDFVKRHNRCDTNTSLINYRQCIRNVPFDELPVQCRESEYYKSLKRFNFEL